ncbi:unnamed protein product [Effrenium voratum]|uniref:EF-hand domain-containing protein n=1 Tax=Effrenium voratum TaxID=2562239 RepID=A0AA36ND79_9DINO|nr:unnamed protein product [Effrenium voratum]CAJ1397973.1 unnamed protein product [Effrenium voratum]CAJ1434983.1 unnamed protein product [Effrenium voratum]|eukprot:CAMPEP_0181470794 /NCGR_PEP_ID=MMETSP1110-20121109/38740_1 /TAXON_ID=174948 /ORGANISM="Symbiodinium sp., Strain CCMP421" /LENGTH=786 /DNA_ID=CAMNT_0023595787 /DNA_START=29 /DNA_END=2389 /DNA_ORIENTATION=+
MAADDDGKAAFARFLDASWEIFRRQMIEVYSETRSSSLALPKNVSALEAEIQELRAKVKKGGESMESEKPLVVNASAPAPLFTTWERMAPDTKLVIDSSQNSDPVLHSMSDVAQDTLRSQSDSEKVDEDGSVVTKHKSEFSSFEANKNLKNGRISGASEQEQEESFAGPQIALQDPQTNAVRHRLRLRLGAVSLKKLISGKNLHDAIEALGLTTYTEEHVNDLVNQLADYIDLKFVTKDKDGDYHRSNSPGINKSFWENERNLGRPVWNWPRDAEFTRSASREINTSDLPARSSFNVVPLQALMDLFLARDPDLHKKIFGPVNRKQFQAMKEILLAGDTNRLVAELTFVRINDLAAPPEPINPLMYIEPFVAVLIVVNGIMIGFQTDRTFEGWAGWKYMEGILAFFLLLESAMRLYLSGFREFACGPDWLWNWFDFLLMLTGITDVTMQAVGGLDNDMFASSLLRFCRLIRLVRVVKVFRLKCMKELRLMVKGLVAGLRTLLLAFALLFAVLYVISGFATMTIGRDAKTEALGLSRSFENIPSSMFTAFRCFCGECNSVQGTPIHAMLAEEFGIIFVAGYVISYMLVTMGIFNVILAVYVDITMRAAKETEATTSEQHARESIRIARTTRELLKKFAQAYRAFSYHDNHPEGKPEMPASKTTNFELNQSTSTYTDEDIHDIAITKELFLLVIQDRTVQTLMDDLDLPPDRANLFEVIDADGSGTMDVTELVQGMLKIRGDVKKSDTVATLLATKALQEMVTDMREVLDSVQRDVQTLPSARGLKDL